MTPLQILITTFVLVGVVVFFIACWQVRKGNEMPADDMPEMPKTWKRPHREICKYWARGLNSDEWKPEDDG